MNALIDQILAAFPNGKTYTAAIGFIAYGVWQITKGNLDAGIQSVLAGLGALGLRHALTKA